MQNQLRRRIDNLEGKMEQGKKNIEHSPETASNPLLVKNYNTCGSCNRELDHSKTQIN